MGSAVAGPWAKVIICPELHVNAAHAIQVQRGTASCATAAATTATAAAGTAISDGSLSEMKAEPGYESEIEGMSQAGKELGTAVDRCMSIALGLGLPQG